MPHHRLPSPPVVYRDVYDSLAWPQLLKAWRFALRPANLVYAAILLFASLLLVHAVDSLLRLFASNNEAAATPLLSRSIHNALSFPPPRADWLSGVEFRVGQVLQLVTDRYTALLLLSVPWILLIALFGGAIARTTALMWTQPAVKPWTVVFATSLRKLASSSAALLGPLFACGLLVGLLSLLGYLLSVPGLQLVGGALFIVPLAIALVAVLLLVALALSCVMLVPAVMIEGTDAIDAVQRCFAYVFAKPVRVVLYWALLVAQGIVLTLVVARLVHGALSLTSWAAGGLVNRDVAAALDACIVKGSPTINASFDLGTTGTMLCFWSKLAQSLPSIVGVSFAFVAGTLLYGTMRRVCDGQDPSEVFDPIAARGVEERTSLSHARDEAAKAKQTEEDA